MLVLKSAYSNSDLTSFDWMKTRRKPECVDPHFLFEGILTLIWTGPFTLKENIKKTFTLFKKMA